MKTTYGIGIIVLAAIIALVGAFGMTDKDLSSVSQGEFKEHVEDANTKFNQVQERIINKLDEIEQLIKEKHK